MNLSANLVGDDRVRAMFGRLSQQLAQRALAATAVQAEDEVEREAAKHTRTGALVQSIYKTRIRDLAWQIGHNPRQAPHAVFVHWGTKPHVIRPENKKALRFPSGGVFRFAGRVNHPGYRGDPWLTRAALEAPRIFERQVAAAIRDLTR